MALFPDREQIGLIQKRSGHGDSDDEDFPYRDMSGIGCFCSGNEVQYDTNNSEI